MGASLTIPISQGRLALGTWQGIYLNEVSPRLVLDLFLLIMLIGILSAA